MYHALQNTHRAEFQFAIFKVKQSMIAGHSFVCYLGNQKVNTQYGVYKRFECSVTSQIYSDVESLS